MARWRQIEKDAKDRLAPDVTPPPSAIRGEIEFVDPASFGALTAPRSAQAAPAGVLSRLAKIGAGRGAVTPRSRRCRSGAPGAKSLEDLGAVVTGVNDGPAEGDVLGTPRPGPSGEFRPSIPLSPAMLADQKAREAKYGTPAVATPDKAAAADATQAAAAADGLGPAPYL